MKTKDKPLFGSIAQDGGTYHLTYHKDDNSSNHVRSGYGPDVFKDAPANLPIIDFRTSHPSKIIKLIFSFDAIAERDIISQYTGKVISAAEYLGECATIGATIRPAKEVRV